MLPRYCVRQASILQDVELRMHSSAERYSESSRAIRGLGAGGVGVTGAVGMMAGVAGGLNVGAVCLGGTIGAGAVTGRGGGGGGWTVPGLGALNGGGPPMTVPSTTSTAA